MIRVRRVALHPGTTAGVLLALMAAGVALVPLGHPAWAIALLAAVAGTAAGFANSGST